MTSPAPSASAVTPEQLAVAARALGYFKTLAKWHDDQWWAWDFYDRPQECIGSDADLFDKLLDTMDEPALTFVRELNEWGCIPDASGNTYYRGPTKLAAVLACIAAMGAK